MRDKPERFRRPAQATMTDMRERRMRGPLAARYRSSPRAEAHSANLGSGTEADCTSTRTRPPATALSQREVKGWPICEIRGAVGTTPGKGELPASTRRWPFTKATHATR